MLNKGNIIFKYEAQTIDSVYAFKDGDFIVFGDIRPKENNSLRRLSSLFDGKTFKSKMILEVSSDSCFFDLKDNEFGLCIDYYFSIYRFNSDRTESTKIQSLGINQFETGKKLIKLLNGDILFLKNEIPTSNISVYKKESDKSNFEKNDKYCYTIQDQFHITDCEDLIELNENEFLIYKKLIQTPESLELKIYNNNNYQIIRKNSIKAEFRDNNNNIKKRLYFTTNIFKANNEKLIAGGCYNLFIIDLKTLELETMVRLEKTIEKILIREENNILIFSYQSENYRKDIGREVNPNFRKYFIQKLNIDFGINGIIRNEEIDITEEVGKYNSCYEIYNYTDNRLASIIDKSTFIIYEENK